MQIRNRVRELRTMRAGDLRPSPRNWRTHPPAQRDALQGVLAEIGYADALLARELEDGSLELIDGHLRAETTPDMEVPVLVLDVNEEEAGKILLTLDPMAALAGVDTEALAALMEELSFDSDAVEAMLGDLAKASGVTIGGTEIVEDEVPEPPDDPVTQPGDLWVLGDHRLLCGDSSNADDLDRLLDGASIDMVNTDPPYNVKVEPRSQNAIAAGLSSHQAARKGKAGGREAVNEAQRDGVLKSNQRFDVMRQGGVVKASGKMRAKDRPLVNDFMSDEAFDEMLLAWFGNIARVLKPGGSFYIWGGYANLGNYPAPLKASELYFSQGIVWDKQWPVLSRKDFMGAFEICFYGWCEGAGHHFFGPTNATDLWRVKKVPPPSMVHLTEKPVELAAQAIEFSSRSGENVLDLFGGSGSTLIACEQIDRHAFLMEIDPAYCDVIVNRWQELTGKDASLDGGPSFASVAEERKVAV
jgi:DNA modification methylase